MCLTPERRTAWLKRLGKPETTPAAELSDDAIFDLVAATHDAREAETGPDGTVTRGIEALSADNARLTTELSAARAEVLALSADGGGTGGGIRRPDAVNGAMFRRNLDQQMESVAGKLALSADHPLRKRLRSFVVGPDNAPTTLACSADPSAPAGKDELAGYALLELVDGIAGHVAAAGQPGNGTPRIVGTGTAVPAQFPTTSLSGDAGNTGRQGDDPIDEARAYEARQLTSRGLAPAGK